MINHFAGNADSARRYAQARPYFHPDVMARIRGRVPPARLAVDAGCGTGHSAEAVAMLAERVIGIDASAEMLAAAKMSASISYVRGHAEELPLAHACADLMTAGLALHWFERMPFLHEAARVLRPGAYLVTYNDNFTDQMVGASCGAGNSGVGGDRRSQKMHLWSPPGFASNFPPVGKDRSPVSEAQAQDACFGSPVSETIAYELDYTLGEFVRYLMTQSNFLAAINSGKISLAEIQAGLSEQLAPCFAGGTCRLAFTAEIVFLRRRPSGR